MARHMFEFEVGASVTGSSVWDQLDRAMRHGHLVGIETVTEVVDGPVPKGGIQDVAKQVADEAMARALEVLQGSKEKAAAEDQLDAAEAARSLVNTAYSALRLTGGVQ